MTHRVSRHSSISASSADVNQRASAASQHERGVAHPSGRRGIRLGTTVANHHPACIIDLIRRVIDMRYRYEILEVPRGRREMSRSRPTVPCSVSRLLCVGVLALALAGCDKPQPWHETDITGAMPPLSFTMIRADDGKTVTADDYKGKVVLVYFGYTFCPDVCPTTLSNIARILDLLGSKAGVVRVLFVTVDPNRDTLPVVKRYVDAFAPQVDGLRGDAGELAALAKRYRVSYSVRPKTAEHDFEVSHGSAVYVFDRSGKIRLLLSSLATGKPEIDGTAADLKRLIEGGDSQSLWDRLVGFF